MRYLLVSILMLTSFQTTVFAQKKDKWFKGNLHTHSLWTDGDDYPEMIMDWYKSHGYDFVALSDHNTLGEGVLWKAIPKHPFRQHRFREYLDKFGKDWVNYRTDSGGVISVRLKTAAEYRPLFEEKNKFLIIPAEEITDRFQNKSIHVGAINVRELIRPQGGSSVMETMQRNLDAVYEQRARTGQPMFPHINHPNFRWSVTFEDMAGLRGERFFEVYNGHPHVHNYGDSTTMGMEELWDKLLITYLGQGKDLLYGLATDDAHNYLEFNGQNSNPGRGWVMVRAGELSPSALIAAMEKGDFYASTGVELNEVAFDGETLRVQVKPERGVSYTIQFWGAARGGEAREGRVLKEVSGRKASYTLAPGDLYVRAKIISSRLQENPFQQGDKETAWTQPVR
ncbi:MAG TPA: hypothetical protein VGD92_07670 [Sphingobacteriaceae bacterium]